MVLVKRHCRSRAANTAWQSLRNDARGGASQQRVRETALPVGELFLSVPDTHRFRWNMVVQMLTDVIAGIFLAYVAYVVFLRSYRARLSPSSNGAFAPVWVSSGFTRSWSSASGWRTRCASWRESGGAGRDHVLAYEFGHLAYRILRTEPSGVPISSGVMRQEHNVGGNLWNWELSLLAWL